MADYTWYQSAALTEWYIVCGGEKFSWGCDRREIVHQVNARVIKKDALKEP